MLKAFIYFSENILWKLSLRLVCLEPISIPMEPNQKLAESNNPFFDIPNWYDAWSESWFISLLEFVYALHTPIQFM